MSGLGGGPWRGASLVRVRLVFGVLPTFPAHNIVGGGRFTMRTASGRPVPARGRKWKGEGLWVYGNELARMEVRVSFCFSN
ncbi:hypothetical protein C8F01DRAFT_1140378 [Mycena amicta]|nr:hypothetical protein C8F01DRAFT_1140378 [Mycena amicta]